METGTEYGDARECLQAARVSMRQVKRLLSQPSAEAADESAALLRDVEVQLGCVAAILRAERRQTGCREFARALKSCKTKWPCWHAFLPERTKCFPDGWMPFDRAAADIPSAVRRRL